MEEDSVAFFDFHNIRLAKEEKGRKECLIWPPQGDVAAVIQEKWGERVWNLQVTGDNPDSACARLLMNDSGQQREAVRRS